MKTRDDRGKAVTLYRLSMGVIDAPSGSEIRVNPVQAQRLEALKRRHFVESLWAVVLLFISVVLLPMLATNRLLDRQGIVIGVLVFTATAVWFFITLTSTTHRYNRLNAITYLPSRQVCPACGHSLRGLSPESDGCRVCPECGAAWRVPAAEAAFSDSSEKSPAATAGKPAR